MPNSSEDRIIENRKNLPGGGVDLLPLLSIVVPVYNVEKYLRQCLDSLINQTLKNIEIIIVNDCSPDNSEAIIEEYAAKDSRIVYLKHTQNLCQGGARNTGIRAARGEYITFVDSDDYVDCDLYEAAINAFNTHPIDIVVLPFKEFQQSNGSERIVHKDHQSVYKMDVEKYALNQDFVTVWNKVYRNNDLSQRGIFFIEQIYWEDNLFWLEFCSTMEPRAFDLKTNGPAYFYRRHEESVTGAGKNNYKEIPIVFSHMLSYLARQEFVDPLYPQFCNFIFSSLCTIWKILNKQYRPEFVENFVKFMDELVSVKEGENFQPQLLMLGSYASLESKTLLLESYVQTMSLRNALADSKWYQFGKLSGKEKIKKVFKVGTTRLFKLLGLSRI